MTNIIPPKQCHLIEFDFLRDVQNDYKIPLSFYNSKLQYGGSYTISTQKFKDNDKIYTFKISTEIHDDATKISVVSSDDHECVSVLIYKGVKDAILHNMHYRPDCAQLDKRASEGLKRPGGGSVLLRFIYQYLISIKNKYKIDKIVLKDTSYLDCSGCSHNISLARLKMLIEGRTWYSKYGFKPYDTTTKKLDDHVLGGYNYNKKMAFKLKTNQIDIINIAKKVYEKENIKYDLRELSILIDKYKILSIFIRELSQNLETYCCLISYILKEIYNPIDPRKALMFDLYGKTFYLNI